MILRKSRSLEEKANLASVQDVYTGLLISPAGSLAVSYMLHGCRIIQFVSKISCAFIMVG